MNLELIHQGKVRDVYAIDPERLLFVATDRISAFDCVLGSEIPDKGKILTKMSEFWFDFLSDIVPNHFVSSARGDISTAGGDSSCFDRSMIVKRASVFPVECVVRGYLEGSGWKEYKETGEVCGIALPTGFKQCERLPEPIFTPATKNNIGHDENISFERFCQIVGNETGEKLRELTLAVYKKASEYALTRGIIIADTKFEFGSDHSGNIILIDEVLTPDSSRFWDAKKYGAGTAQASFDKQYVREYLETLTWDKTPPAPILPEDVIQATIQRYNAALEKLTT